MNRKFLGYGLGLVLLQCPLPGWSFDVPFANNDADTIAIEARLNDDPPLLLMLHTAATDLSLTPEGRTRAPSVRFSEQAEVDSWGGRQQAGISRGNTLSIADRQWASLAVFETGQSGPGTVGKFGLDLFANEVLALDFGKRRLRTMKSMPKPSDRAIEVPVRAEAGSYWLRLRLPVGARIVEHDFLVHTGYAGGLLFDDAFAANSGIAESIQIESSQTLTDSFGHAIEIKKGRLRSLQIGSLPVKDIPVGFFSGKLGQQSYSVIGLGILRRFDLVFDLKQHRLQLTPLPSEAPAA